MLMRASQEECARLQDRLLETEWRARESSIRIHGMAEGTEGADLYRFIETLLCNSLELRHDQFLGLQKVYRAGARRPPDGATPRSVVLTFQQVSTAQAVLKRAWDKNGIKHRGKKLRIDLDYPTEIVNKRKEYSDGGEDLFQDPQR